MSGFVIPVQPNPYLSATCCFYGKMTALCVVIKDLHLIFIGNRLAWKFKKKKTNAEPALLGLTNSNGLNRRKELQVSAVSSTSDSKSYHETQRGRNSICQMESEIHSHSSVRTAALCLLGDNRVDTNVAVIQTEMGEFNKVLRVLEITRQHEKATRTKDANPWRRNEMKLSGLSSKRQGLRNSHSVPGIGSVRLISAPLRLGNATKR